MSSVFWQAIIFITINKSFLHVVKHVHGIKIILRPYSAECFTEHPSELHDLFTGSFFVEKLAGFDGKEARFDMSVTDPNSNEVYNAIGQTDHKFEYQTNIAGIYTICFTNTGRETGKLTYLSHTGHHWDHGKATKTHLDPVLEALQNLDFKVSLVSEESKYHKFRARRHAVTAASTLKRVKIMAILEGIAMILATTFQLIYMKILFRQRESFYNIRIKGKRFGV